MISVIKKRLDDSLGRIFFKNLNTFSLNLYNYASKKFIFSKSNADEVKEFVKNRYQKIGNTDKIFLSEIKNECLKQFPNNFKHFFSILLLCVGRFNNYVHFYRNFAMAIEVSQYFVIVFTNTATSGTRLRALRVAASVMQKEKKQAPAAALYSCGAPGTPTAIQRHRGEVEKKAGAGGGAV